MTSSAYYRRMRLHTASTLDLPVRFLSLSFRYHPSKNDSKQQFVHSKDLRTNTLVWSHPQPTLILLSERCRETTLLHYVTPSLSGPSPRPNISSEKCSKPKPFKPDVSGASVAGNADDAVRLCHPQPHQPQEPRLACQKGDTRFSTVVLKT